MQGLWLFQELQLAASLEGEASSLHSSSLLWREALPLLYIHRYLYKWEHLE